MKLMLVVAAGWVGRPVPRFLNRVLLSRENIFDFLNYFFLAHTDRRVFFKHIRGLGSDHDKQL